MNEALGLHILLCPLLFCFQISSNGVTAVCLCSGALFAGSGNGKIKKLQGSDTSWNVVGECDVEGRVVSLSPSASQAELIVGLFVWIMSEITVHEIHTHTHRERERETSSLDREL